MGHALVSLRDPIRYTRGGAGESSGGPSRKSFETPRKLNELKGFQI
jgi:hypothetical protein